MQNKITMITLLVKGSLVEPAGHGDDVPLEYIMRHVSDSLRGTGLDARLLILKAMTASGKSTTIPPVLYTEFSLQLKRYCAGPSVQEKRRIICTQPRVITTISIPHQIVAGGYYHKFVMGQDIGYQTKIASEIPVRRGVLFVVLQVLAIQLLTKTDEEIMNMYGFIIIDEAHERSVDMDRTLALLKAFLRRNVGNPRCPYVVIMSATFDPPKYREYFGGGAVISVRGFSHAVEERWAEEDVPDYVSAAAEKVRQINREDPKGGDILVFMPSKRQADDMRKMLEGEKIEFIALNRMAITTYNADYRSLSAPRDPKKPRMMRRVIVSTSVAETGITLPALGYVVDSGWAYTPEYSPWTGVYSVIQKPAAQSMIQQRRGRVGREGPGVFYPLYTRATYDALLPIQMPDIIKEDATGLVLSSTAIAGGAPLDFLDNPSGVSYHRAVHKLVTLGLMQTDKDGGGRRLTAVGEIAAKLVAVTPSVEGIKMILSGFAWDACVLDLITIAAFNSMPSPAGRRMKFETFCELVNQAFGVKLRDKREHSRAYFMYKLLFADEMFDALIYYEAFARNFEDVIDVTAQQKWCEEHEIDYDAMLNIIEQREAIIDTMIMCGVNPFYRSERALTTVFAGDLGRAPGNDAVVALKQCIWEGYRNNVAHWNKHGMYEILGGGVGFHWMFYGAYRGEWKDYEEKEPVIPRRLVYSGLDLQYNSARKQYEVVPQKISVMDGFVRWTDP